MGLAARPEDELTITATATGAYGQPIGYDGAIVANATTPIFGVLTAAAVSGKSTSVATQGICDCPAGGTIAIGDALAPNSTGRFVATTTSGDLVFGRALSAATVGQRVLLHIVRAGKI